MSYTMYTPLNVWLDPASVTDVVAYIQNYLSENTIYSEEEIEELIHDYLIAHPELIGGVQSVNGKTGTVVLSASDINTQNNVTIESVLASLSSQISSIASSITNLTGRVSTAETDITNLKSSVESTFDIDLNLVQGKRYDVQDGVLKTFDGSGYNAYKSTIIDVSPGDVCYYSGRVFNYLRQYSLIALDSENVPQKYELNDTEDTTYTDYEFLIPSDVVKLIIQSYETTPTLKRKTINSIDVISEKLDTISDAFTESGDIWEV